MAYCKSCGAYIPDGQTVCLACGYDETAEQNKSSGSAAAAAKAEKSTQNSYSDRAKQRQVDSEFLRQQLEEQRKRQQENSRKWAETEYAQRQRVKQEQTRNFTNTSGRSGSDVYRTVRSTMQQDDISKGLAGLSYFSVLFVLPYIFRKDDDFAMYHAKQGMSLFIAGIIGDLVGGFLGLGWLVALARIAFAIMGVSNVIKGLKKPLPYIGKIIK